MDKQDQTIREYQRAYTLRMKGSFKTIKLSNAVYEKLAKYNVGFEKPARVVERLIDFYIKQNNIK